MTPTAPAKPLTPAEAAAIAGRSECSILRWVRSGKLPATKHPVSGRVLIESEDLARLITPRPATAGAG